MLEGAITLIRPLAEHWVWTSEKFTKGQAWVDLILLANDGEASISKKGTIIQLQRGDIGWNQATLAARWRWAGKTTVSYWFKKLCREGMLTKIGDGETAIFRIANYDQFNPPEEPDLDPSCTTSAPDLHHPCTTSAHEGEGEEGIIGKTPSASSGTLVPPLEEFVEHCRAYPGDLARSIPPEIPEGWALDCFNWMQDESERGKPWPKKWRDSVYRRFRAAWVKRIPSALGQAHPKNGSAPGWQLKKDAATLRDQIAEHPANPHGVSYAGEFATDLHRQDLQKLKHQLLGIEKQMSEHLEGGSE